MGANARAQLLDASNTHGVLLSRVHETMSETQEKHLGLLEQGELEVDSDSTLNEDERPPTPVAKTRAQLLQLMEFGASRLAFLRPSFLGVKTTKTTKLRRTAYLDGLKGFAALLVYFGHHELWAHAIHGSERLENTFGYQGEHYFGAFPFVRTFFSGGHYAVATFFVISGYVLSTKPLSLIQAGEHSVLVENVASALFRRWIRLFLPILIVTFGFLLLPHVFGVTSDFVPQRTLRDEIWKWYVDLKNFTFVWNLGGDPFLDYHKHVWSIPVEFRGSITIYTLALAFSRLKKNARLMCEVAMVFYFIYIVDGGHYAMFTAGMLLSDLDLLAMDGALPKWMYRLEQYKTPFFYTTMVLSIGLGGVPSTTSDWHFLKKSPGWSHFAFLAPQALFDFKWFFLFWAAFLAVASSPRIPFLKTLFETRFCQHLGRISYMFYLMHGPILWTLGDRLYAAVGWVNYSHALIIPGWADSFPLPAWGPYGLELNYILPQLILLPLTIWVAEITTVLIDDPSIKIAQWFYSKVQAPKGPPGAELQKQQRKA